MSKQTLSVYGNCQSGCIAEFMRLTPGFADAYDIPKNPDVQLIQETELPELYSRAKIADVLLTQEISTSFRGEPYSSSHLSSFLKESARLLRFPTLYFSPYFPNLLYVQDMVTGQVFNGPGWDYHDRDILDSFIAKRTVAQTSAYLADDHLYDAEQIKKGFEDAFAELRRREETQEIKISDWLLDNFTERRLFYVFNHPANEVMFEVCARVARTLGVEFSTEPLKPLLNWLSGVSFPVPASVHKVLGLKFAYDGRFNAGGGFDVPVEDAVEMFFKFYTDTPQAVAAFQKWGRTR